MEEVRKMEMEEVRAEGEEAREAMAGGEEPRDGWVNVVAEKREDLSSEERKKLRFICGFGKLLKRNGVADVKWLRYMVHRGSKSEKVVVFYEDGGYREVDVTADSLCGVMRDLLAYAM